VAKAKLDDEVYESELERMQLELVDLQEAIRHDGLRLAVVFEGRDTAGKGGTISRIVARLNPRGYDVVALPTPTERERGQWYFQRHIARLPAAGEIALFDRSWYNRAGVEPVMGFCTAEQTETFLRAVPDVERRLVEDGLILVKYWLEVSPGEQDKRLRERVDDPAKRWKIGPVDLEARRRYEDYSAARDEMLSRTDTDEAPWFVVDADNQKRARLNCIQHLLDHVPARRDAERPKLPRLRKRPRGSEPPKGVARVPERW
jgi:polyphosphate kinase